MTAAGLKDVYKGFNLVRRRAGRAARARSAATACTCSGRSSSGCRAIAKDTFDATVALADKADLTFAQFVLLTPFPGTIDFEKWAKDEKNAEHEGRRRVRSPSTG